MPELAIVENRVTSPVTPSIFQMLPGCPSSPPAAPHCPGMKVASAAPVLLRIGLPSDPGTTMLRPKAEVAAT